AVGTLPVESVWCEEEREMDGTTTVWTYAVVRDRRGEAERLFPGDNLPDDAYAAYNEAVYDVDDENRLLAARLGAPEGWRFLDHVRAAVFNHYPDTQKPDGI